MWPNRPTYEYGIGDMKVTRRVAHTVTHTVVASSTRHCENVFERHRINTRIILYLQPTDPSFCTSCQYFAMSVLMVQSLLAIVALVVTPATVLGFVPSTVARIKSTRATAEGKPFQSLFASNVEESSISRRQLGEISVATAGLGVSFFGSREVSDQDYGLWGILPVGTYKRKPTIRETIIPGKIWTFDQKFGILNVQVPLRMTVVKLSSGGVFVYNPIAPTREMLRLLQEVTREHGEVRHIAVGSVALEHKVYAGNFAQKFPNAKVWLTPGQYSFPANLPNPFLGFPSSRTFAMPRSIDQAPAELQSDFDLAVLGPIISRDGAFAETVFFHKDTHTLIVTDTCLQVTDEVPPIYDTDPAPLLYHARDTVTDIVTDTPATRVRGWKRVCLFGLFFMPSAITIKDVSTALNERRPDINPDFAGIYPWDWDGDEEASWKGLTGEGKPLVAPILQVLLLNRSPVEVLDFADRVAQWPITRIIPAHLKNDLKFSGKDYRAAFGFLEESGVPPGFPRPLDADLQTLRDAEVSLLESQAIVPAPPKVGGEYSRSDIISRTIYRCRGEDCAPKSSP